MFVGPLLAITSKGGPHTKKKYIMKELKSFAKEVQAKYIKKDNLHNIKVTGSQSVAEFIKKVYPVEIDYREAFMCLYLNRANNTISFTVVGLGGISGTVADPKVIFQHALLCNASSVILIHNHPSGNLKPSQSDITLTEKIKKAGSFLDIPILDHVIITEDSYFSFADEGIL